MPVHAPTRCASRRSATLAWTALALLLCNDHLLKGSGLLPGVVTGKLSDLAGLFVVPTAVALALRWGLGRWVGARALDGLAIASVAVPFVAIQHPVGARLLVDALATGGLHWRVWPDPTDLLALPALPVGWCLLAPFRRRGIGLWGRHPAIGPPPARTSPSSALAGSRARRLGTLALVALAGVASLATSKKEDESAVERESEVAVTLDDARATLDAPACAQWIDAVARVCAEVTPNHALCGDAVREITTLSERVAGYASAAEAEADGLSAAALDRACRAGLTGFDAERAKSHLADPGTSSDEPNDDH